MTETTPDGWWKPGPDGLSPPWTPVNLAASGCSEIILLRSDGSIRRVLHDGPATLAIPLPPDPCAMPPRSLGDRVVLVPQGETRLVVLPDPEPQWVVR